MVMRSISMVLFMGVFIALWHTAFGIREGAALAGYTLVDMVWYLAMTETVTLSASRVFVEISEAVKSGDLVYTLTRPISYPFFQVANSLGDSMPRFWLNLAVASAVVTLGVGVGAGSWPGVLAFLGTAMLALLLDALIAVLIGLSAFWLEEVMPVFWIYQKLLFTVGGLFLPLDLFPGWLRRIAAWLPFRFIAYVPARAFVAFEWDTVIRAALGQCAYIAGLGALVIVVWYLARRRMVIQGG
jgi:ABC-2 type transport system permease protein